MSGRLDSVRAVFRAVAEAMVPATQRYDDQAWGAMECAVEQALLARPVKMQRQLLVFLRLANLLALPLAGRTLVALAPAERERVLHRLERSPVPLIRRGVWGVRTLIFLGHYTRPEVVAASGWKGSARGWAARDEARPSGAVDGTRGGMAGTTDSSPRPS